MPVSEISVPFSLVVVLMSPETSVVRSSPGLFCRPCDQQLLPPQTIKGVEAQGLHKGQVYKGNPRLVHKHAVVDNTGECYSEADGSRPSLAAFSAFSRAKSGAFLY